LDTGISETKKPGCDPVPRKFLLFRYMMDELLLIK
jgi:hypothetical protein